MLYIGAYFVIGTTDDTHPTPSKEYRHRWQAILFGPAVQLESAIRRQQIEVWTDAEEYETGLRPFMPAK
jgi:hypothetical protein